MCFSVISVDSFSLERFPDRKEESVNNTAIGILIIHKNCASYHSMCTEACSVICLSALCGNCVEINNRLIMNRKLRLLLWFDFVFPQPI